MMKETMKETMDRIVEAVEHEVGGRYVVGTREVRKNNGVTKNAVTIQAAGERVAMCIYIDGMLGRIGCGGMGIQDAAGEIVCAYRNAEPQTPADATSWMDRAYILDNVVYQMVNTEANAEWLHDMPHREFLDLSAVYRVILRSDGREAASVAISNEICRMHGISGDELDLSARRNTEGRGFRVATMEETIAGMSGVTAGVPMDGCPPIYILSNMSGINGAAVVLYGEYLGRLAADAGCDLYVLPSSIHEVIAVPDNGTAPDPGFLRGMVAAVNSGEVQEEEVLGWNVYRYIRAEDRLVIA